MATSATPPPLPIDVESRVIARLCRVLTRAIEIRNADANNPWRESLGPLESLALAMKEEAGDG